METKEEFVTLDEASDENNTVDFKDESCVEFEGKMYPLTQFNQFNIRDGKVYMVHPTVGLAIEIDIDNRNQTQALGIEDYNVQMIKLHLARIKENEGRQVPIGYENKFCALFSGKVFHSFDTREELNAFKNGPNNVGLMYTFYYPLGQ